MIYFDEMQDENGIRSHYKDLSFYLKNISSDKLSVIDQYSRNKVFENASNLKIYQGHDLDKKIYPLDIIPRIITIETWNYIIKGITQRIKALNTFLNDIYGEQAILRDNVISSELIYSSSYFIKEMIGVKIPHNIYLHISAFDLIRDISGEFLILEDNLRIPSGIYSTFESRNISKTIFPELATDDSIQPILDYPKILINALCSFAPKEKSHPCIIMLSLGLHLSYSYFEQYFLANKMGIPLVTYEDLVVDNNIVYLKTNSGLKKVDVIYRRMDDEFFSFSILNKITQKFSGIYAAYLRGKVVIVNAIGNGVADDKAIYSCVPKMIKYYLNEEPILKNVATYLLHEKDEREYVFKNIESFVIKKTDSMRGIGMLMGNSSSSEIIENYKLQVMNNPRNFIAQPIISFSKLICYINGKLSPRRIDLRPYALLTSDGVKVANAVLTRVAIKEDSYDVSSPQGARKDTWILNNSVLAGVPHNNTRQ